LVPIDKPTLLHVPTGHTVMLYNLQTYSSVHKT